MSIRNWFKNIRAGHDFVGRDKITNVLPKDSQLDKLSKAYKIEQVDCTTVNIVIDELHHYNNSKSEIRNLETKLTEAGFDYLLDEAEELKELVAKLIIKYQHYASAQKIITFLLADVESSFNANIKPKLSTITTEIEVKKIFRSYLEKEIQDKLGENVLEIYNRQLNGMVFFLTGNCHIEWK